MKIQKLVIVVLIICVYFSAISYGQTSVDFASEQFTVTNGQITEHLGHNAFMGTGAITNANFKNGIIEFNMCVTGARSYPGIFFRVQSANDYEHIYIRPHRAGLYPDAVQYTPCSNGIGSWQLFNGEGYTSPVSVNKDEWFPVRVEILNDQARVIVNGTTVLKIHDLYQETMPGGISLNSPANGSAFFSDLRYTETEDLEFSAPPVPDLSIGIISDWQISQAYSTLDISLEQTPESQNLHDIQWQQVRADDNGLVNIGKYLSRQGRAPDVVFCKTNLMAEKDTMMELKYGYSDAIVLFLNNQVLAYGSSGYTERDPSFLGIVGLFDGVYLPLKKGNNELILAVAENFGGWGFMCQWGNSVWMDEQLTESWETDKVFDISESVLYDPKREVLYISNFDQFSQGNPSISQSISKLSLLGEVLQKDWIKDLNHPLGMTIFNDKLYVAERRQVAKVDPETGNIISRIDVPGAAFLNDIAVDDKGNIYVSDSRKGVIWRISDNQVEEWLSGAEVTDPNVLYFYKGELYFGNSGDHWLKTVNPMDKQISNFARFPEGFIDGIRPDGKGNLLVSLWKGKLYLVDPAGNISLILHTENKGKYIADFEYIPEKKLLIIPTFYGNTVAAYEF